ncbi:efflux RND transporter periplasmic adaptor subunit [Dyella koreensis]|uniref:Multidrug efflux pump subunit AcrA (Membrane-fusion protein) n=1 Tax=Dyella koreensis TaxID=311235 RepID=A0ABW8K2C5_9GAMM
MTNRMYQRALLRGLVVTLLGGFAVTAAATELNAEGQAKLGLTTAALQGAQAPAELAATAEVLDPSTLSKAVDDMAAAQAAAEASGAEYKRVQALFAADGNMSRKAVEAARAQSAADQAKLRQLQAQLRVDWGAGIASLSADALRARAEALLSGQEVLIKAEPLSTPPAGFAANGASLRLSSAQAVDARVVGALPRSSGGLAGGWLLQASAPGLTPGMMLTAQLQGKGESLSGVLLPRSAVVRWNGVAWAYVVSDATHFERRAVKALAMTPTGWLVGEPFKTGEKVVTRGVEALIALDAAPVPAEAGPVASDD